MHHLILSKIRPAIMLLLWMSLLLGILYPLLITGIGQLLFPWQANGSLLVVGEKIRGSALIGQYFSDPKYFWGRISATEPYPYNASASKGSNLGPSNPVLVQKVKHHIELYQKHHASNNPVPIDLVTASASGLDPEISPSGAYYQVARIAKARNIPDKIVEDLIATETKGRLFGLLGEPRLNVLELNLRLDQLSLHKSEGQNTTVEVQK